VVTGSQNGSRSIVDKAKILHDCAQQHEIFYSAPEVLCVINTLQRLCGKLIET